MLKSICGVGCDPNQSDYMTVSKTEKSPIGDKLYVTEIEYFIDEEYTMGTFNSCKKVVHPSSGLLALDLACGAPAKKCTDKMWFDFMGTPDEVSNPFVPFRINYIWDKKVDNTHFTAPTKTCNESYPGYFDCSCVDCTESCPAGSAPTSEDSGFLVFELNGTAFVVAMVIGGLGVIGLILGTILGRQCSIREVPKFLGGFRFVNKHLTTFFTWWGQCE